MKTTVFLFLSLSFATAAYAFSLGGLAKGVADVAAASDAKSSSSDALTSKQTAMVAKYADSKKQFVKGYAYLAECFGTDKLAKDAQTALEDVSKKPSDAANYAEIAKTADALAEKTSSDTVKAAGTTLSDSAKQKYQDGFGCFQSAIVGEMEAAQNAKDLALQAKDAISSASTMEKVTLATSLQPTLDLAQTIPDDLSKTKAVAAQFVKAAKESGLAAPASLLNLLGM